ncbi:hypothetical protein BGY98DRAFT_942310 [Russula aff. rugulosa BPL654]|nr:hypothetical protein BGY98DRAFT_942310 [Russula aff. rugulosa BPL654]
MKDMCERLPGITKSQELIFQTINAKPVERTIANNFNDNFCGYSQSADVFANPPVLSVNSIRDTPKPGSNKIRRFIPLNMKEVLNLNTMELPSVEEEKDPDTQTKDVIHCRLAVDQHKWKEILLSYQASPFLTTHTNGTESTVCDKYLYRTPSPPLLAPLPQTPPLFSGTNVAPKKPAYVASMADLQLVPTFTSSDSDDGALEYVAFSDEWDAAASSTLSPPTSLNNSPSKRDVFFVPSSEPRGPIDDLLAAEMETYHVPRQSRVGGFCETLSVPGQGQRLHEYIGRAVFLTRGRNTITTTTPTSDDIVTPLTSVHRDAFPTPDNMLRVDFPDEAINASGLMDGQWCALMTCHTNERTYSTPVTRPKRAWSQYPSAQRYEVPRYLFGLFRFQYGQGYQVFEFRAYMEDYGMETVVLYSHRVLGDQKLTALQKYLGTWQVATLFAPRTNLASFRTIITGKVPSRIW